MNAADKLRALRGAAQISDDPEDWDIEERPDGHYVVGPLLFLGPTEKEDATFIVAIHNAAPQIEALIEAARLPTAFDQEDIQLKINGHFEPAIGLPKSEYDALQHALSELEQALK